MIKRNEIIQTSVGDMELFDYVPSDGDKQSQ